MSQKQNPSLPRFKDQADSVPAERRRSLSNRDPDGTLLAAEDGTLLAAQSHKVSTARQAKAEEPPPPINNDKVRAHPSSAAAAEATAAIMAFDVVAVEDTTTGDPLAFAVVDNDESIVDNEESISVGTSNNNNNSDIVPNINKNNRNVTAAPSQINHVHAPKSFPWNTAIVAVVVIAIAAIAGVVVGVVCGSGGCGGTADPSATTSNRSQDITNFINSKSYMGVNLSPTGTSPEERALQWLIQDDPLQLNVGAEVDEFRLSQRYSLLTVWFQAGTGTTWTNSTNWLTADECTWYGIYCQSGVVTGVDFYQNELGVANGLHGTLSPDLGLLTDLTALSLGSNSLSGSLPSEFSLWTNLKEFYVWGNALTGSLPSEIGLWTNLEWFSVFLNNLTGSLPSEIGLWTNLEVFSVRDNALAGTIPATIANWKLIEDANFYGNNFSGSMPDGICVFISGEDDLRADCLNKVTCSCCTYCE